MLSHARAFRRRPYALAPDAPPLWRGLAALDGGDREQARVTLEQVLQSPDSRLEESIAYYYLGVLAARDEDWNEAGRKWSAACATGLSPSRLTANVGELYHRIAEDRLQGGDIEGALDAASEASRHKLYDKRLDKLFAQVYTLLAHRAASAGQWAKALDNWEKASEVAGSNFRLAYNLALAHERSEDFIAAGETWREALRRRPRRSDHPDAVSDEQVARLWRRAAEAYQQGGEYEEAANVCRQALKWDPDNLETRMALVEQLLNDGRLQAAQNELCRILERDPDHIPALLRMGEAVAESGHWWSRRPPNAHWERVLELDPTNAGARQLLVGFYEDRAENYASWGHYEAAVSRYEQALKYEPKNGRILAALGGCYFKMGDPDAARSTIQEALRSAPRSLDMYTAVIGIWLEQGDADQAWKAMAQAEAAMDVIPFEFYIYQAAHCIELRHSDLAHPWLVRALEKAPPDQPVLMMIGEMAVMMGDPDIGGVYLWRAIQADQAPGQAYLILGILAAKDGNLREARKHWREAEKIARRTHDAALDRRIALARSVFGGPQGLMELLRRHPSLLEDIDPFAGLPLDSWTKDDELDLFDDDQDDDDGFFFER